jgi:hypothetical protein
MGDAEVTNLAMKGYQVTGKANMGQEKQKRGERRGEKHPFSLCKIKVKKVH